MAARRGVVSGRVSPAKTGARRNALKARLGSVSATPHVQIAEMQRARLLAAAVATFAELGYARASVAHITARARVSRRTFYDMFENREDCLLAVLQDAVERIEGEIAAAELDEQAWRERVRGGLLAILSFFDREPTLARVCVVQALQGGPRVLQWREEILVRLAGIIDEGCGEGPRGRDCTELMAEGLVGAGFAIAYARLVAGGRESLRTLAGELMSLIVLPYLGAAAARSEQRRVLPPLPQTDRDARNGAAGVGSERDPLRDVPMRLTYRTARVLEAVADNPGASNRTISESAGMPDQGQVSKLLARLEHIGLMANTGGGQAKGEPNAWRLTPTGQDVTDSIVFVTSRDAHTNGLETAAANRSKRSARR